MEKIHKEFLGAIFSKIEKKYFIWGAGVRGKRILKYLRKIGASNIYFIDRNPNLTGKGIEGIKIYDKTILDKKTPDDIVIVSVYNAEMLFEELSATYSNVFPSSCVEILEKLDFLFYEEFGYKRLYSIDHYYSCYPDIKWCELYEDKHKNIVYDIDMREKEQLELLNHIKSTCDNLPEWTNEQKKYRYFFPNGSFEIGDALLLHNMIRTIKPNKIVEIGSGFSSSVMLDTNEFYFNNKINLSFIEPYPMLLKKLLRSNDIINLQECMLQRADISEILNLQKNDILFIDSSHVCKRDSDVNMLLFEILPQLKSGVYIHFHDIFDGFEYPLEWTKEGRLWNEDYILRAFLMNNNKYDIVFLNPFMQKYIENEFPYEGYNAGGSLWIRKR